MRKLFKQLTLVLAVALFTVNMTSCSKYEEGSKFTVLTKKARLAGDWKMTGLTDENGIDQSAQITGLTITFTFEKDGSYSILFPGDDAETGTWDWASDKENIILTDTDGDTEEFQIIKLKNKELKLKDANDTNAWTYEFEQ